MHSVVGRAGRSSRILAGLLEDRRGNIIWRSVTFWEIYVRNMCLQLLALRKKYYSIRYLQIECECCQMCKCHSCITGSSCEKHFCRINGGSWSKSLRVLLEVQSVHSDFQGTGMIPFLASALSHVPEITIAMLMRLRSRSCHHVRNIALWNSATGGKFPEVPTRCVLFFHGFNPLTNEFKFSQVVSPLRSCIRQVSARGRVRAPECLPAWCETKLQSQYLRATSPRALSGKPVTVWTALCHLCELHQVCQWCWRRIKEMRQSTLDQRPWSPEQQSSGPRSCCHGPTA